MIVKDENANKAAELMAYYTDWYVKSIEGINDNRKLDLISQEHCDEMKSWVESMYDMARKMYRTFIPEEA